MAVIMTSASIIAVLLIVPLMAMPSPAGTASKVSVRRTGLPDFIASPERCRIAEYLTIPPHDEHDTDSNRPARRLPDGWLDSRRTERPADGPGAPAFTAITGKGANAPIDKTGDFVIGPDYAPAPEREPVESVPHGKIQQFSMDSKDSKFYPGIARDVFGTVDPNNPKALIVQTHAQAYQRTITVYVPAQYKHGAKAPFIVIHDGPKMGEPDVTLAHVLDNLIAQKRVPALVAISIQNGGGDAQGSQRGLEYDTMSGKFAEFIEAEVLPAVEKNASVKLTHKPDGRAAMGCSSGAAAAFTMAWYHPEWYHRIVSYSGTFVNQQWPFNPET